MTHPPWEEIEHTADWALRVRGEDLRELFENAARGMAWLAGGEATPGAGAVRKLIDLDAPDYETLLVDWLTELLYWMEDADLVLTRIRVERVEELKLEAEVEGIPGAAFSKHIKAATYHGLNIRQSEDGWEATVVFDV